MVVVPFPAGGSTDALARILAEPMRVALGQPVIVQNVPEPERPSASPASFRRRRTAIRSVSATGPATPAALAAHHESEIDKWWPVIKEANIKAE